MDRLNKNIVYISIIYLLGTTCYSQSEAFEVLPKEYLNINTNTNLFVSGESIYYNLYCFNDNNSSNSISKIAYVLLIDDNKKVVFKHKLSLHEGIAYGDYFIPSNLKTGHYKLVSFTNWMKNNTNRPFSQTDLYIINPYSTTKKYHLKTTSIDSLVLKKTSYFESLQEKTTNHLQTNSQKYNTRSKVVLELNNLKEQLQKGHYSLAVRRVDSVQINKNSNNLVKAIEDKFYLPEIRGEIVSGSVFLKDNSKPAIDKVVTLSIEGNPTVFKSAKTDSYGKFYFNLHENFITNNLIIQVVDSNRGDYKIDLDDFTFEYMDQLQFSDLFFNKQIKYWLLDRSKNNQIESTYFNSKRDLILREKESDSFYGQPTKSYLLNDYTRFPTMEETFIEIINYASIKTKKGKRTIVLYTPESQLDNQIKNLNSLVLIDGIPIQNHEILLELNPKLIDKIELVLDKYIYGPNMYDGILSVMTKEKDFALPSSSYHYKSQIENRLAKKTYYKPNYGTNKHVLKRIPDFRIQLLWNPDIQIKTNNDKIIFYTSDVKGLFEVVLTGYKNQNEYVKFVNYFEVE